MTIQTMIISDKLGALDRLREYFSNMFEKYEQLTFIYSDTLDIDLVKNHAAANSKILLFEDCLGVDEICILDDIPNLKHVYLGQIMPINTFWGYEITKQLILCTLFEDVILSLGKNSKKKIYEELVDKKQLNYCNNLDLAFITLDVLDDAKCREYVQLICSGMISFRRYSIGVLLNLLDQQISDGFVFLYTRTKTIDYNTDFLTGSSSFPDASRYGALSQIKMIMADVGVDKPHYLIVHEGDWVLSGVISEFSDYRDEGGRTVRGYISVGHKCTSSNDIRVFKKDFLMNLLDKTLSKYWDEENGDKLKNVIDRPISFSDDELVQLGSDKYSLKNNILQVKPFFGEKSAKVLYERDGYYCSNVSARRAIKQFEKYRSDRIFIYSKR